MPRQLFIFLAFTIKIGSACISGGSYSEEQKQWCKKDVKTCARYLCNMKTTLDCDKDQVTKISNMLECKFQQKCDSLKVTERSPCLNDGDCQQESQCRDGVCRRIYPGQNCVFDGQCDFYYSCENRRYCRLDSFKPCSDMSSCDKGLRCVAGYCRPKYSRNICFKDTQCPSGYNCDRSMNKCSLIEPSKSGNCSTSEQCDVGFKCRRGTCITFRLAQSCTSNDQCKNDDYECFQNNCLLNNPLRTCRSSLDCDAGQYCKGRQCTSDSREIKKDTVSPSTAIMETPPVLKAKMRRSSEQQCYTDMDCPIGQRCRNETCLPTKQVLRCSSDNDCDSHYSCQDRECVLEDNVRELMGMQRSLEPCQTTKQCPPRTKCLAGLCRPYEQGKTCNTGDECGYHYRCDSGKCLLKNMTQCSNDDDCTKNFTCSSGFCSNGIYSKCLNDSQCSPNFRCYSASCIPVARSSEVNTTSKSCNTGAECSLSERCESGICVRKRTG